MKTLRIYAFSLLATAAIWAGVGAVAGLSALLAVIVLTVLEVTFSFDNAVVNSKLLTSMSPFWQRLFMTVGILVAVFAVRFALPIGIVALTAGLGFGEVIDLAVHHPAEYSAELAKAGPLIDAFGGTFLIMIAIGFFLDGSKQVHWIGWLERRLAPLGRYDNVGILAMIAAALVMVSTVDGPAEERLTVLIAAACGIALHMALDIFGAVVDGDDEDAPERPAAGRAKVLVGAAAAVMFARLEVLDASFSFDGVIGAFAISSSVLVIMAGLGAGALWVRSMTVHLVRAGTLARYQYLEHGAHWAIAVLGGVMLAKLYDVEPPEWVTGSIGLVLIAASVLSSVVMRRRSSVVATDPARLVEAAAR
ncbi:DUF475 domain-containing protein [Dactylosporangium sp. NPDC000555]|uniref:DUF475 domain-containing protein n=1 Tax=Dactylosporangium sp. NPDC000555 TaxID=3154260 RepID=UPI003332D6C0